MTAITAADITKIIKDELTASRAAFVQEAVEKSAEVAAKKAEALPATLRGTEAGMAELMKRAVAEAAPEARTVKGVNVRAIGAAAQAMFAGKKDRAATWAALEAMGKKDRDLGAYMQQRGLTEASFTSAGGLQLAAEVAADFIEALYAKTVAGALGAQTVPMSAQLDFGKQNSTATAYYVGEAANITPSMPGVGSMSLKRKKLAALVPISNELLRNPVAQAQQFVANDLLKVLALKRDLHILRGLGTENAPKGIKNWIAAANSNGQSGTTAAAKVTDLIKAISLVDGADIAMLRPGWAFAPRTLWALMATLDANSNFLFQTMLVAGNLFGFQYRTTTQIPINLGGGTNESEIYFGDWSECVVGEDASMTELQVFENGTFYDGSALVSGISTDQSVVRALEGHDVLVRHNKAFAMVTAVTWAA